jgi:hypothetical protein
MEYKAGRADDSDGEPSLADFASAVSVSFQLL